MLSRVTLRSGIEIANELPITVFGGLNVLEDLETTLQVAKHLKSVTAELGLAFVFKASFDKANRSHLDSYRGPGFDVGLGILHEVKSRLDIPIISDIHDPTQAGPAAEVLDVIQIPAFLSRQTDLLAAAVGTGRPVMVKKMQMMAPAELGNVVDKCSSLGCQELMLCERGTSFGYGNLVVDPTAFPQLKSFEVPVVFDVTHSLQQPGALGQSTGGRGEYVMPLALAGVSQGLAGLFFETHPNPARARCDGPCALPLDQAHSLLKRVHAMDALVKEWSH